MRITELVKKNQEYNDWKKEVDKQKAEKQEFLQALNRTLNLEEVKQMSYDDAKVAYEALVWNMSSDDPNRKQLGLILQDLKKKAYPVMCKAHYYPIINEMDFLSEEQKHMLDKTIKAYHQGYIRTGSTAWGMLRFDTELTNKVLEWLADKLILSRYYKLYCGCNEDGGQIISEADYRANEKYYVVVARKKFGIDTQEEREWLEDFVENGNQVYYVGCECEGRNINSWEDLNKGITVIYKNTTAPDLTYEKK